MGFIEYYKLRGKNHKLFRLEELPDDVRQDLFNLIGNYDKRIGFYVGYSHKWNDERTEIIFDGMLIYYYVRSFVPDIIFNDYGFPCGLRFWRMKKVTGGY